LFRAVFLLSILAQAAPGQALKKNRPADELRGVNTHYVLDLRASLPDWEARRSLLRKRILTAAGLNPAPKKTPLNPLYVRQITTEFCTIDTLTIETLPGFALAGNLYLPLKPKKKMPAVLVPHGHWKHGRVENLPEYSVPALAMNLARQGYVVFAYDMIGYNDTNQLPHDFGNRVEQLWSYTPLGLQLWNSIRAVDFLVSLPIVDENRIAATGASGGGTQTFVLSAVDDRVRYSAPVNMISAYMQGGDPCEEAPGLRTDTFNVEIAAMAAPRPMLMVSCTGDWTKHTPEEEYPAVRSIYQLYGHETAVANVHVNAKHNYNSESREAVYRFLGRLLQPAVPETELKDHPIGEIKHEELLVNAGNARGMPNAEQLFLQWKLMSREQTEHTKDKEALRERLRLVLNVDYPATVEGSLTNDRIFLPRTAQTDGIECFWRRGKRDAVLIVHSGGIKAALATELVKGFIRGERSVLIVEPYHPRLERIRASDSTKHFYSYNLPVAAIQVQDIVTALAFLKTHAGGKPQVWGLGAAGIWTLFAAAVTPVESELIVDFNGFAGTDEDFGESFFVPGIQRAGGLQAALRLTNTLSGVAQFKKDDGRLLPLPIGSRGRRKVQ
jgi:dienelactone hydrolase